jgi:hypothetical protein
MVDLSEGKKGVEGISQQNGPKDKKMKSTV